ncbi:MAG: hypothetical protein ACT4PZ_02205 [Panacagrimonas sp.]
MAWVRATTVLLMVATLGACASPHHRPYDPVARNNIQTIGLLTPALPDRLSVRLAVHPGQSLGVVGALVAEGEMSGKSIDFTRATQAHGLKCSTTYAHLLTTGLESAGYNVVPWQVWRSRDEYDFLGKYPKSNGTVDAYLDLYSSLVGYTATGVDTPYRPTIRLHVRLVRARDHKVLYQDEIAYNAFGDGGGAVTLSPSREFEFNAFEHLMAAPDKAIEGLQTAMRATGDELVRQLR